MDDNAAETSTRPNHQDVNYCDPSLKPAIPKRLTIQLLF